jgi:KUP system potassium uptake protein
MTASKKVTFAGLLITIGIVFGDIGTSPLYVFTAITEGKNFDPGLIIGSMSCVFWTLVVLASFKYIYLALNSDNRGEGGIFALYALLQKTRVRWIVIPALIGCATLISDGFLTPAISISSAIEGLNLKLPSLPVQPIVVSIIVLLFLFQQFGTQVIGKAFGPIMVLWFSMLGVLGFYQIVQNPDVLKAMNPLYAVDFVLNYPMGIWILGAVFLCTTGAEALYSDLGHFGKKNIRVSWSFVVSMLLLNYFGQAAFCLNLPEGTELRSVFYATIPQSLLPFAIAIATMAAIIASQALITGIFTLVNEAIKLKLWTNLKVKYPTEEQGQIYIPLINYFLMFGCLAVVFIFGKSSNMESAYGLAIVIDMLMTSLLLGFLLIRTHKRSLFFIVPSIVLFLLFEFTFLVSNSAKIPHGGWFSLMISFGIFILLLLFYLARRLRQRVADFVSMKKLLPVLETVMDDESLPYVATHLVYPARSGNIGKIDTSIAYSLTRMSPKRAQVYWFVHIDTVSDPTGIHCEYDALIPGRCYFVKIHFGFKEAHQLENVMKEVFEELAEKGEISGESVFEAHRAHDLPADVKYVLVETRISQEHKLHPTQLAAIRVYRFIKSIGLTNTDDFGLSSGNSVRESLPVQLKQEKIKIHLK